MIYPKLFSVILSVALASAEHLGHAARSHHLSKRVEVPRSEQNVTIEGRSLEKRFSNARFSFYQTGLGACGKYNNPGDFIVALNSAQYDADSHCFDTITISYNGKSTQATIVDRCPGCPFGGLDLSEGLFSFLSNPSVGIIYGEWNLGGAPAPPPPPPPPPKPTPTPTPTPKPSSTSSKSSSSSSSKASAAAKQATSTNPAAATATGGSGGNLNTWSMAIVGMGGLVGAAGQ